MITKHAITEAAMRLMKRKQIDKITVTDIVKECHIARQTFYYHFQDIDDVVEWAMRQKQADLMEKARTCRNEEEALLNYCCAVMENKWIFSKVMNSRYSQKVLMMMVEGTRQYIAGLVNTRPEMFTQPVKDLKFLVDYHAGALAVQITEWMQEKDVNLEEEIHQIMRIVTGKLTVLGADEK